MAVPTKTDALLRADVLPLRAAASAAPTFHRLTKLMHDPQYRVRVASQNAGYNQPPHPGSTLGDGMPPPLRQPIYVP